MPNPYPLEWKIGLHFDRLFSGDDLVGIVKHESRTEHIARAAQNGKLAYFGTFSDEEKARDEVEKCC